MDNLINKIEYSLNRPLNKLEKLLIDEWINLYGFEQEYIIKLLPKKIKSLVDLNPILLSKENQKKYRDHPQKSAALESFIKNLNKPCAESDSPPWDHPKKHYNHEGLNNFMNSFK